MVSQLLSIILSGPKNIIVSVKRQTLWPTKSVASLSDEASKSDEEREAERKEKAKQRRSRTNFSLEQVLDVERCIGWILS